MQWSKTKKVLEGFLCEKLQGRVQIHATVLRKFHDSPGRVWITFDQNEILRASDVYYRREHEKVYQELKKNRELKPIPTSTNLIEGMSTPECKALWKASDDAEEVMIEQGIFETFHLYQPFLLYHTLSIEDALNSENVIIQAFAMFDRRLGKRRLRTNDLDNQTNPLILRFYQIRCEVEGIQLPKTEMDS